MIEKVREQVEELLNNDNSGHGMDHINRVLALSLKFAEKESANKTIVSLVALLHDVDDYKLFGSENAKNLTNAKIIMNNAKVPSDIQVQVLENIKCIGYSKALEGIRPTTIEGKVVSDADMCDALGVNGFLRVYKYTMKTGKPFFDRDVFPIEDVDASSYTKKCADTGVCHMFEKILRLKSMMLTEAGKSEALARHQIIVDILYHLFEEENALDWQEYLDDFLRVRSKNN